MNIYLGKARITLRWPVKVSNRHRDRRRSFTHTQQVEVWHRQNGLCGNADIGCGEPLDLRTVIYHHILPWWRGGLTVIDNCVALCPNCHQKTVFEDVLVQAEENGVTDANT